jgi:hypothetical protein
LWPVLLAGNVFSEGFNTFVPAPQDDELPKLPFVVVTTEKGTIECVDA